MTKVLGYFVTQAKLTDTLSQGLLRKNAGQVFQENPSVVKLQGIVAVCLKVSISGWGEGSVGTTLAVQA